MSDQKKYVLFKYRIFDETGHTVWLYAIQDAEENMIDQGTNSLEEIAAQFVKYSNLSKVDIEAHAPTLVFRTGLNDNVSQQYSSISNEEMLELGKFILQRRVSQQDKEVAKIIAASLQQTTQDNIEEMGY